jgi:TorA maturation chaperone TorD
MTASVPLAPSALSFASADQREELERAELYGLLANLWLNPPDAALLAQFQTAVTEAPEADALLQGPWTDLVGTLRASSAEAAAAEHEALFHGIGKPEVFAYGSYYLSGFLNEKPLATLRADLDRLGLTRDASRGETEDHVAYVFEVMRYLIAGDDAGTCNLEQQRRFFRAHVQPWVEALCDAVVAHPRAQVWRSVAELTRCFMQIETQGFDLLET